MDGTLSRRLASQFLSGDRQRGRDYFARDFVAINQVSDLSVTARVRGSYGDPYQVDLDLGEFSEGMLSANCKCRRFQDGYNCKHIWATILQLEASLDTADVEDSSTTEESEDEQAPDWKKQLSRLREQLDDDSPVSINAAVESLSKEETQHWFVIALADQVGKSELRMRIFESKKKPSGEWSRPQRRALSHHAIDALGECDDQEILNLLQPAEDTNFGRGYYQQYNTCDLFQLPKFSLDRVMSLLSESGRFGWTLSGERTLGECHTITWDEGPPWQLRFRVSEDESDGIEVCAELLREDEQLNLDEIVFAFTDGWLLCKDRIAKVRPTDVKWVNEWKTSGPMQVGKRDLHGFLSDFLDMPQLPNVVFDESIDVRLQTGKPSGKLILSTPDYDNSAQLQVRVIFQYGDCETRPDETRNMIWDGETRTVLQRDLAAEAKLLQTLKRYKFQTPRAYLKGLVDLRLHEKWLSKVVSELTEDGWEIRAHGKLMRNASAFRIEVTSDTDWFDLNATVEFEGTTASLPTLLAALKKKQDYILLDDGTRGVIPKDWLQQYTKFAHVGTTEEGAVRFAKSQALLLDALLAEQQHVSIDKDFHEYCERVHQFGGIQTVPEPETFQGELRAYQRDGLGWLTFLRDFELGGCLADDMGLGKTVQVLAMLESRRTRPLEEGEQHLPSIVVVPKSLVFNWMDEAERFSPDLHVVNYTGADRGDVTDELADCDLVVTTYGTLRRDIATLKKIPFDYAILDESQAIKNASSQAAKASRLLQSKYRLALSGTPIENHLGELWSLFDFLNPGMLGKSAGFRKLTKTEDPESLQWLNRALKPFFLRRTKSQVLTELPEKTEQTLYCEMDAPQQKLYDELRDHYRGNLGRQVRNVGIRRSKIHVLEALLRLRQAACDPRLLDPASGIVGAKLELLVEKLSEVIEEGHKALVFSQFTSLLALVRQEIDQHPWDYEYLDGKTTKRAERVKRFQNDEECKLFLISLKAGGHGLNLTAADYVFILDPWWNPAVEAQAVDRAHRIGQTRHVMAYRLICRDTVEDKIVKLQESKRELANAIVTANESLISSLSTEDLQVLLT